jgi:hypothetical protein
MNPLSPRVGPSSFATMAMASVLLLCSCHSDSELSPRTTIQFHRTGSDLAPVPGGRIVEHAINPGGAGGLNGVAASGLGEMQAGTISTPAAAGAAGAASVGSTSDGGTSATTQAPASVGSGAAIPTTTLPDTTVAPSAVPGGTTAIGTTGVALPGTGAATTGASGTPIPAGGSGSSPGGSGIGSSGSISSSIPGVPGSTATGLRSGASLIAPTTSPFTNPLSPSGTLTIPGYTNSLPGSNPGTGLGF